jgi:hypothetical protein
LSRIRLVELGQLCADAGPDRHCDGLDRMRANCPAQLNEPVVEWCFARGLQVTRSWAYPEERPGLGIVEDWAVLGRLLRVVTSSCPSR